MRRNFLVESAKLIILGVALGMLARYILGDPVSPTDHGRSFNSPVDAQTIDRHPAPELPDYPLRGDWSSEPP